MCLWVGYKFCYDYLSPILWKIEELTAPVYWQDAIVYLSTQDEILASLIAANPDVILVNYHNPFFTLMKAVVGQQISVKAADAVWQRLENLLGTISPTNYLTFTEEELRACGLSHRKIDYIRHIAKAFEDGILNPDDWQTMDNEAVVKQLTSIKGIGIWTAEMFLIFYLQRPDILPLADLGLINAIHVHYSLKQKLSKAEILNLSLKWKPYRTVATWYLWLSLDPLTVQY